MEHDKKNVAFAGTIPAHYDEGLGPVIFFPYADDLAKRVVERVGSGRLLETACGTGILTRRLDAALPRSVQIKATDLNEGMLAVAQSKGAPSDRLSWQTADACALPFGSHSFDAVACQFGFMFVPDKPLAFREARRVLRPGGWLLFNVWSEMEANSFARTAHETVTKFFDSQPPNFYQVPFGYHDPEVIAAHMRDAGFVDATMQRLPLEAKATSARAFAHGLVEGNPIANSIREAGLPFGKIVDAVTAALVAHGGDTPFKSTMTALVCSARAD